LPSNVELDPLYDPTDVTLTAVQAQAPAYSITGTVAFGGSGLPAVAVSGSNGLGTATTDSSGKYTFANVPGGSYTLTPVLGGYAFTPPSATVTLATTSVAQNFTAMPTGYSITGNVAISGMGLAGVTLTATGGASTVTDSSGNYTFVNMPNGTYALIPSLAGYSFSPYSQVAVVNDANVAALPIEAALDAPPNPSPVVLSRSSATASPARVRLSFTGPLSSTSASDVSHYSLTAAGQIVAVTSAAYSRTGNQVTLAVKLPSERTSITVRWAGVVDSQGRAVVPALTSVTPR
jgi:hypothetical protein